MEEPKHWRQIQTTSQGATGEMLEGQQEGGSNRSGRSHTPTSWSQKETNQQCGCAGAGGWWTKGGGAGRTALERLGAAAPPPSIRVDV